MEKGYALEDACDRYDTSFEGSVSEKELKRQASAWIGIASNVIIGPVENGKDIGFGD